MEIDSLAARIDHAFLRWDREASVAALKAAVELVRSRGLRSICVSPVLAGTVKKHNPGLRVCAVVSYPLGADSLAAKLFAAQELLEQGIDELDVVMDLFAILNGNWRKLELEARELLDLVHPSGKLIKAIIEVPILDEVQLLKAAEVLVVAGIGCLKSSTGYKRDPTTPQQVALLRRMAGDQCLVKASGGIGSLGRARELLSAGADILGCSASAAILAQAAGADVQPK
jgi:deoxyribose-phosphate aldolase